MTTSSSLAQSAIDVYEAMRRFSNEQNICRVSFNMLVKASGYCRTTVIHATDKLAGQQWIRKYTAVGVKGEKLPNVYELLHSAF
jgi:hypothetical protein